jgi:hypothetical protein
MKPARTTGDSAQSQADIHIQGSRMRAPMNTLIKDRTDSFQ